MATQTQMTDFEETGGGQLHALDFVGLAVKMCGAGAHTCYRRVDGGSLELGVLPGHFSASEIAALYKDAGLVASTARQSLRLAA